MKQRKGFPEEEMTDGLIAPSRSRELGSAEQSARAAKVWQSLEREENRQWIANERRFRTSAVL
jgi:hypothetical protein